MSEPKQISPLLDGFTMGNPMSDHDGVRCCPAIKENSETKYIVKVISIPASQVQMDALLLSGAYKDASGAMDYYKTVADDVVKEAELLTKLSKLEGFLSYEGWQIEPITRRRLGYEVYLVGDYRRSLDKFVNKNPITQLEAINLGLDMCAALSVCRQAGALYVDLKPTNIFVSDKKEYRIGDLGFVSLDALSYTALPDKYRSVYTPPELEDPMVSVGMTTDTYALGMILYQIYNDGQLPPHGEEIPSPVHADYELAEIILKAIAKDPESRWQDPREMGQALVAYMQRNAVNDVPITPYIPLEENAKAEEPQDAPQQEAEPSETQPETEADSQQTPEEASEEVPAEEPAEECEDESAPGEEDADALLPHEMSDEMSRIMAKADDLIAHEAPEGVVVPEIPEQPDPFAFAKEDMIDDTDVPLDPLMDEPEETKKKKKKTKVFASKEEAAKQKEFLAKLGAIAAAGVIGFGGFWGYQNLYLQTVDAIAITGDRSQMSVEIRSDIADEKLTVTCADQFGNVQTGTVENGRTAFSGLLPNTMYTVSLDIDGFHKLAGQTSQVFTTDTTTTILSFTSVAGQEDGSLILSFTVDGQEPEQWSVAYAYEGGETQYKTFTGHSFTVEDLKIGRVYTFQLDAGTDLSLGGDYSLDVMASRLILAENITASSSGSDLTLRWRAPGDILVDSWKVLCYNDAGFNQELTVSETSAYFPNIDPAAGYTIEITAAGMTQAARYSIAPDPINITSLRADESHSGRLEISWDHAGEAPEGGWLVLYSIDGSETAEVVKSGEAKASIAPRIPGATYRFTIQAANGKTVLSNVQEYTTAEAPAFADNNLKAETVTADLVKTPDKAKWSFEDVGEAAFATTFAPGDKISMVLRSTESFYVPGTKVNVLTVIRDAQGNVVPSLLGQQSIGWFSIWDGGDLKSGEVDLPVTPEIPGSYTVSLMVDGMLLGEAPFEIVQ